MSSKAAMSFCLWMILALVPAVASSAQPVPADRAHVPEIRRQWDYLDQISQNPDEDLKKSIRKKTARLLREIESHLSANGVEFERIPTDPMTLFLKVSSFSKSQDVHPLNRFARSLYLKFEGLRVVIDPLQLKLDQAGALFDEETHRLILAVDNVIDLQTDSFVGHELIHARFSQYEKKGLDHVYHGWLKRKENHPIFHETYPDAFSLDEMAAYYYQCITLLREARRSTTTKARDLSIARRFLEIGALLSSHVASNEIQNLSEGDVQASLATSLTVDGKSKIDQISLTTPHLILELQFAHQEGRSVEQLKGLVLQRLKDLKDRSQKIHESLTSSLKLVEQGQLSQAETRLSQSRSEVIRR